MENYMNVSSINHPKKFILITRYHIYNHREKKNYRNYDKFYKKSLKNDYVKSRRFLFENFTLTSIDNFPTEYDFIWFVFASQNLNHNEIAYLKELKKNREFMQIVLLTDDRSKPYNIKIKNSINKYIRSIQYQGFVVTANLDSDDSLAKNYLPLLDSYVSNFNLNYFISFPLGYKLTNFKQIELVNKINIFIGLAYLEYCNNNSIDTIYNFFKSDFKDSVTGKDFKIRHNSISLIKNEIIVGKQPIYIYNAHKYNHKINLKAKYKLLYFVLNLIKVILKKSPKKTLTTELKNEKINQFFNDYGIKLNSL